MKNKTNNNENKCNFDKSVYYVYDKSKTNITTYKKDKVKLASSKKLKKLNNKIDNLKNKTKIISNVETSHYDYELINKSEKITHLKTKFNVFNYFLVFIEAFILLGAYILIKNMNGVNATTTKVVFKYEYIAYFILIFFAIMLLQTVNNMFLLSKKPKLNNVLLSYKTAIMQNHYNNFTFFGFNKKYLGINYLMKNYDDINVNIGLPIYVSFMEYFTFIIFSLFCLLLNIKTLTNVNLFYVIWGLISFCIIIVAFILCLILFSNRGLLKNIVLNMSKLLFKLNLTKDYMQTFDKYYTLILEYKVSLQFYLNNLKLTIFEFLLNFIKLLLSFIIFLLIFMSFNSNPLTLKVVSNIFSRYVLLQLFVKSIPISGKIGFYEFSFIYLFKDIINLDILFWVLLLDRFFNSFIYLLQTHILNMINYFVNSYKKNH